jgi:sortase A
MAMRWISRALFLIGFVALSYSVGGTIDAELYQIHSHHAFEEEKQNPPKFAAWADESLIGQVEIPKIGLSVMVADGIDWKTLRRAVGHVPGTAFPGEAGNAAIAAHRDTFFRGLGGVSPGDSIIVNTRRGAFHYVVESTEIVKPNDVRVLRPSTSPKLTLITCYPFHFIGPAPKRFIVHATMPDEFPSVLMRNSRSVD